MFGHGVPKPVTTFAEAGFPEYLLSTIRAQGFPSPTPIQCQAWPMALSGRDVVAIAQTGQFNKLFSHFSNTELVFRQWEDNCIRLACYATY